MSAPPIVDQLKQVLAEKVGPALDMDGAAVEVLGVDNGVARVRLSGVCGGCPGSVMAVVMGMEQEIRRWLPEIDYMEVVP